MRIQRKLAAGVGALATVVACAVGTASAEAAGPPVCIQDRVTPANFFCPLSTSRVPVYKTPALGKRVGFLNRGGLANYFRIQLRGQRITRNGVTSLWWAQAQADRAGRTKGESGLGYVSEAYFSGGGRNPFAAAKNLPIDFGPSGSSGDRVSTGQRP